MCKLIDTIRSRCFSRIAVCVALVVGIGVGIAYATRPIRPTRERFELVKEGMTRDEVIALVGGPPGDYTNEAYFWNPTIGGNRGCHNWLAEGAELLVRFAPDGTVEYVDVWDAIPNRDPPSMWERIRRAIGL